MQSALARTLCFFYSLLLAACSPIPFSQLAVQKSRLEADSKAIAPNSPATEDANAVGELEKVSPPSNVSGSYLVCELNKELNSEPTQATGHCALRDLENQLKVDLKARYRAYEWKASVPALEFVTNASQELPDHSLWQFQVLISAKSLIQLDQAILGSTVTLSVVYSDGRTESTLVPVLSQGQNPLWLSLEDRGLPAKGISAGSAQFGKNSLELCRVYDRGGVFPGKLIRDSGRSDEAICVSTRDSDAIKSLIDGRRTLLNESDLMISGSRPWNELLEWTTIASGAAMPSRAFVGGVDEKGESLVTCRGLERGPTRSSSDPGNSLDGEWTPGYAKVSTGLCQREYGDQQSTAGVDYQILVWKTAP